MLVFFLRIHLLFICAQLEEKSLCRQTCNSPRYSTELFSGCSSTNSLMEHFYVTAPKELTVPRYCQPGKRWIRHIILKLQYILRPMKVGLTSVDPAVPKLKPWALGGFNCVSHCHLLLWERKRKPASGLVPPVPSIAPKRRAAPSPWKTTEDAGCAAAYGPRASRTRGQPAEHHSQQHWPAPWQISIIHITNSTLIFYSALEDSGPGEN